MAFNARFLNGRSQLLPTFAGSATLCAELASRMRTYAQKGGASGTNVWIFGVDILTLDRMF